MTVAISTRGSGWEQALDERFGRASGFLLIDSDSEATEYIDNTENVEAAHGAGTGTVQMLITHHVDAVITGRIGPKASHALEAAGITVVLADAGGTVRSIWKNYRKNELSQTH